MKLDTVTLVLITADRCVGIQQYHRDGHSKVTTKPMRWIGEPDAETHEVVIEYPSGEVVSLDGDTWRMIESAGRVSQLIKYAFTGDLSDRRLARICKAVSKAA